jgi:hypothetical protein
MSPAIKITAEDLLAGANATYALEIPPQVLRPHIGSGSESNGADLNGQKVVVELKPVSLGAFQLISKAAKDDPGMIPVLMIKEACVEPALSINQIKAMHIGLVEFLIEHIRLISGLSEKKNSRTI